MAVAPFVNSAILAAGAVAISLPAGALLAILLTKLDFPGRRAAIACLGVLLFLPLYVQLSAWDAAFGKLGWYSLSHGSLAEPFLSGMRGAIFVHGISAVPWVALIVGIGLLQVDPAQEEAALLIFPPSGALWRVTLRQSLPFIVGAAIWTVVITASEMTVTNIYLVDPRDWTFTERFYMRMASGDAQKATVGLLPGVAALGLLIAAAFLMVARLYKRRAPLAVGRRPTFAVGHWWTIASGAVWLAVLLLLAVPVCSLINKAGFVVIHDGAARVRSWSLSKCLSEVATAPLQYDREHGLRIKPEFRATLLVGGAAATLAIVCGSLFAWRSRRNTWWAMLAVLIMVLGLTIPGPVVGAALIQVFNHDLPPQLPMGDGTAKSWLLLLYDNTPLAPIIAQTIRALPLAIIILWHSFATLSDDVLDAAALDGLSTRQVFWRIAVPQRWRALIAAWITAFAIAAGDLAWVHLVTPPGLDLLQRRVFGLVHSGVEEQVAAISLCVVILYAALAFIVMRLLGVQRRGT